MKPIVRTAWIAAAVAIACGGVWIGYQQLRPSSPTVESSVPPAAAPVAQEPQTLSTDLRPRDATQSQLADHAGPETPVEGLERVQAILDGAGSASATDRIMALREIRSNLTAPETDALYQYLAAPAGETPDPAGENWVRNELMDILVDQTPLPAGLASLFETVYHTADQDVVMRDYALQHMSAIYGRISEQEQGVLRDALWEGVEETDTSIAGTSLLALLDVSGPIASSVSALTALPEDHANLAHAALQLAGDDQCGELSRITAVQVCGRMKVEQALPVITQLAQDGQSVPLRIAAIAALGDLGDEETSLLLQRLADSAEPRQALAADAAGRRILERTKEL